MSVVFVADARGHLLERVALSWIRHGRGVADAELLLSTMHPAEIHRAAERAGMLHWGVLWPFAELPNAARVPQTVVAHHVTASESHKIAALRHADAIATSSLRWQRRLREITGREVFLAPLSVDSTLFVPRDRAEARRRLGIDPSRYVIGFAARAASNRDGRKGIELFTSIVREASARWRDVTVLLIGSGWEKILGDGIDVVYIAPSCTEETAALYPAMDVFVCTASEEGGPVTILEAMACAVPVITTNVGHVPEIVRDGVNGFVIQERDVRPFLDRIRILRNGARDLGIAARETIVSERDDTVVVPAIDFGAMHASAREHFAKRSRREMAVRKMIRALILTRYAARRLRSSICQDRRPSV